MFIQVQLRIDEEGQVVFHGKIKDIFQSIDFQFLRVGIISSVDRVIKIQKIPFITEDKAKQTILVAAVRGWIFLSMKLLCPCFSPFIIENKTNRCNL